MAAKSRRPSCRPVSVKNLHLKRRRQLRQQFVSFSVCHCNGGLIVTGVLNLLGFHSGPNWIHGTDQNPITKIADATSTRLVDFDDMEETVFSPDGKKLDRQTVSKVSDFVWTTIEEAFEYSNCHKDTISPDRSLLDFFREKVDRRETSSSSSSSSITTDEEQSLCLEYCKLWGAYIGDCVSRQSLKFFCLEECIDGSKFPFLFFSFPYIYMYGMAF